MTGSVTADYKSTLFLPRTAFPMKAGLPKREPELLERWRDIDLWGRLRAAGAGREKFILHDGPPYANGPIHIGHALNKILKDMVNRVAQMSGRDAHYIPGWDCHGLPIEWQIEVEYRKRGIDKDSIPVAEFRRRCRDFADRWIDSQMAEFVRLGVLGDWERRYLTMSYAAEAQIVREMGKFLLSGALYRGARPVMWSPVEKTALAEAEVEYRDIESDAVYAGFPVVSAPHRALEGAAIVIWTTTPWTIPATARSPTAPTSTTWSARLRRRAKARRRRRGQAGLRGGAGEGRPGARGDYRIPPPCDAEGRAARGRGGAAPPRRRRLRFRCPPAARRFRRRRAGERFRACGSRSRRRRLRTRPRPRSGNALHRR